MWILYVNLLNSVHIYFIRKLRFKFKPYEVKSVEVSWLYSLTAVQLKLHKIENLHRFGLTWPQYFLLLFCNKLLP